MKRRHWFEFEDQSWLPASLRRLVTDLLAYQVRVARLYDPILPILQRVLRASGQDTIVDLGSGSGGPVPSLLDALRSTGHDVRAILTDKHPQALEAATRDKGSHLRAHLQPVEATDVPHELAGFRTMFASFHHLKPGQARRVIDDAVSNRCGIGIFEFTERRFSRVLALVFWAPFVVWLHTLAMAPRPLTFLLTFVIPAAPLLYTWDALVSHLRTYSTNELAQMMQRHADSGYVWEIGQTQHPRIDVRVTYLVAWPTSGL